MKKILKRIGVVLLTLLVVIILFGAWTYYSVGKQINKKYEIAVHPAAISIVDSAVIARGKHLTYIDGCRECHGPHLEGRILIDAPPFRIIATNLTPGKGGIGTIYTEEDWERAIQHGVDKNGTALAIMPSQGFAHLGKEDLNALIVYLKTLPPVDNELPKTKIRLLGRMLIKYGGANLFHVDEINHTAPITRIPKQMVTAKYGKYLYRITCNDCHKADFQGGLNPDPAGPRVPPLTAAAGWLPKQFSRAIRTGVTPTGAKLDPKYMPWKAFSHMTDQEIEALHLYLQKEALPHKNMH